MRIFNICIFLEKTQSNPAQFTENAARPPARTPQTPGTAQACGAGAGLGPGEGKINVKPKEAAGPVSSDAT